MLLEIFLNPVLEVEESAQRSGTDWKRAEHSCGQLLATVSQSTLVSRNFQGLDKNDHENKLEAPCSAALLNSRCIFIWLLCTPPNAPLK